MFYECKCQVILGPATVGGIQAGAFKIGDTAGTIDNIIQCKLYRPGSVGFVSKSVSSSFRNILSVFYSALRLTWQLLDDLTLKEAH